MTEQKMTTVRIVYIIAAIYEAVLAIPFLGGIAIIASTWTLLGIAFIVHVIAFVMGSRDNMSTAGPVLGMVASIIGIIPIIGWMLHVITAVVYLLSLLAPRAPEEEEEKKEQIDEKIKDAEIVEESPVTVAGK